MATRALQSQLRSMPRRSKVCQRKYHQQHLNKEKASQKKKLKVIFHVKPLRHGNNKIIKIYIEASFLTCSTKGE